jgi:hypothetical protein
MSDVQCLGCLQLCKQVADLCRVLPGPFEIQNNLSLAGDVSSDGRKMSFGQLEMLLHRGSVHILCPSPTLREMSFPSGHFRQQLEACGVVVVSVDQS